ncbi:MAG: hypothetical protein II393_03815 [Cytophagales bacterium]|nr:hypothetical protein [Cytophagales bacterium]
MENEEEDFDLIGGAPAPTDEDNYDEEEEETSTEEAEEEVEEEEKVEEEPDEEEETTKEPPKKDNKTQALTAERARRKAAEKELKELKSKLEADKLAKDNEDKIAKEREAYKQKMLEGDLVDEEVADKLLDVFGEDIIKTKIANQARTEAENFENAISELKRSDLFMDADNYKPQIKELMKKGLTAKQAYMASISDGKFSQLKKDLEIEAEQRVLNSTAKADKVDLGAAEAKSEVKRGTYTKREQEIAKETGLPVAEVHKRYLKPGETYSMEDIENL